MKKRLFAIMLALAMLLAAVPALAEEGEGGKALETAAKITRKVCEEEVEGEGNLCVDCAAKTEGGTNGGSTGSSGDNTDESSNTGNNGENTGNTSGEAGDNNGESNNTDSTGDSDSTGGDTGTNGGQKPPTSDEEGGNKETCEHHTWTYEDAPRESTYYCHKHKKTCSKCKIEVWEDHAWNRANQEMVEESTCTKQGKDKLTCTLCKHVTYALRELKPHTKDNGTVIKPATCTEKGTIKYKCTVCGNELLEEIPALGHRYGEPTWSWYGLTSAKATFTCTRNCCGHSEPETASIVRSSINNCGYYTYTATVQFNGETYTDTRTDYSCRPDWYYDPCYYNNPCGHWGCGNVCTRYSNCVPCRDYRTTFRVGGYNCLATPKTGDVSVIGMALISLAGAGAAIMGKKRK